MSYEFKSEDLWGLIYKIGGRTRRHGNEIQFETCPICTALKAWWERAEDMREDLRR